MDLHRLGPYFGTWILDPTTLAYGDRPAPRDGTYVLRWARDRVSASVRWTDAAGEAHETAFELVPDGIPVHLAGRALVSEVTDEGFVSAVHLDSIVVHRAVRSLEGPDTMRVVQSGVDPDGTRWTTEALYRRADDFPASHAADYDAIAERYAEEFDGELDRKPFDRERLEAFARELAPGPVADLGCGPGQIGAFLASRGVEVVGIDISERMLDEGRRRHPEVRFVHGDLLQLPLADRSLAGVVAFYSLIHLTRPQVPRALAEIARVLRADGQALLAVHAGAGVIGSDSWYDRPVTVRATLFGADELGRLAEDAGMRIVASETRPPYPFEVPTTRLYLRLRIT